MIRTAPRHRFSSRAACAAPILALLLGWSHAPARAVAIAEFGDARVVRLDVLDVSGRLVASQDRVLEAGRHTVPLARDGALPPGIYVVRMTWRGLVARTSVVVLR